MPPGYPSCNGGAMSGITPVPGIASRSILAAGCLLLGGAGQSSQAPIRPAGTDSDSVDLNLPAYRLVVRSGDSLVERFTVAIGAPAFPTPIGEFALRRVELNPGWI